MALRRQAACLQQTMFCNKTPCTLCALCLGCTKVPAVQAYSSLLPNSFQPAAAMQKYLPFTDDLQIALQRCQSRFRAAVLICLFLALCALGAAGWHIFKARDSVLAESAAELQLKEAGIQKHLSAWSSSVETFATDLARQSLVQLAVSSYAAMDNAGREAVNTPGGTGYDEDRALFAYLKDMFATFASSHAIEEGLLVMADGDVLLGEARTAAFSRAWKGLLAKVIAGKSFVWGAFHSEHGRVFVNVAVPIFPAVEGEHAGPIGALIMALPLGRQFRELLTPPPDHRGIRKLALMQLDARENGTARITVQKQGETAFHLRESVQAEVRAPAVRVLQEDTERLWSEDHQNYYTMYFPGLEEADISLCAMVPQGVIDQNIQSRRYVTVVWLCVAVAFLAMVLVVASLLRDRYVRTLVNRRIAEQKAILDSINASIQDGMVLLDKNGHIIYMNEHFFTAAGHARWVNLHLAETLERHQADQILACMQEVLVKGQEASLEMDYVTEEGATRLYRVTIYPGQESEGLSSRVSLGCVVFFRDITEFRKKAKESQQRVQKILEVFSIIVESVDAGLRGHTEKIMAIIEMLAPLLHFSREEHETLRIAARLFQVGKLFVPRHLLNKRGRLTPEEYAQVSRAPGAAYELLYSLNFGLPVAETVYEMGERMDGRGPRGMRGEEILFTARVLAAVNAFCSMVSPRSYRTALTVEEALQQLRADAGFDAEVVEALCAIPVKDFQTILCRCTGKGDCYQNAMALWEQKEHTEHTEEADTSPEK